MNEALIKLEASATIASASKAQLLITPEMFLTGYNIGAAKVRELAEPRSGSMLTSAAEIARRHQIAILVGLPELAADGSVYNAVAFIDEQGRLINIYRKTHLYGDVDRLQFSAGSCLATPFQFQGWTLATAICYDIEFPEVARHYAQLGVDALLVPTANMTPLNPWRPGWCLPEPRKMVYILLTPITPEQRVNLNIVVYLACAGQMVRILPERATTAS